MSGKSIIIALVLALVLAGLALPASIADAAGRRGPIVIEGDRIALGDVSPTAPVELLGLDIGPAPAPGGKTVVSRAAIRVALQRAGAEPRLADGLPSTQIVQRAALVLDTDELEAIVRERLAEHLPLGIEIESLRGLSKATLPHGELDVKVRPGRLRKSTTVSVMLRVDDRLVARQSAVAILSGEARTPTLRSDLPRGSVVGAGDIEYERTAIENLPSRVVTRNESIVGKRLVQPGKAGRPVQRSAVQTPPAIERGSTVRLVAAMKGVTMSRLVVAQEDGWVGDTIRVRPDDTRDTLDAKVVSASEVRVPMGVSP